MAGPDAGLPACPHCGASHPEEVLVCPTSEQGLPLEGRLLDGKFRLRGRLGQGGMSTVWRAENIFVHRDVAIKLLHPELASNPRTLARFRNEATAAGRIGSDHICDILDFGQSPLGPYIVMEMLRGQDLGGFISSRGVIEPELAVLIVRQALEGLAAAHNAGIIHRDLKPENIFLHEPSPGRLMVKLMDFGISKFTAEVGSGKTGVGVLMGTPEYMSPEQTKGAALADERTDIWAMGAILYYALAGVEAFRGPTLAAVLMAVQAHAHRPLPELRRSLPPGLCAVVDRALEKDPLNRFPSAVALSNALAPFERGVSAHGAATLLMIAPRPSDAPGVDLATFGEGGGAAGASGRKAGRKALPTPIPSGGANDSGPIPAPVLPERKGSWSDSDSAAMKATTQPQESRGEGPASSWAMGTGIRDERREPLAGGGTGLWGLLALLALGGVVGGALYLRAQTEGVSVAAVSEASAGPDAGGVAGADAETGASAGGASEDSEASESEASESTGAEAPGWPTSSAGLADGGAGGSTGETGAPAATGDAASGSGTGGSTSGGTGGGSTSGGMGGGSTSGGMGGGSTSGGMGGGSTSGSSGGSTGGGSTGGSSGGSTSGGSGGSTGGSSGGSTGGGSTSGGGTGGGGMVGGGRFPELNKLVKQGRLFTTKEAQRAGTYARAIRTCRDLKTEGFANLSKWRLATVGEILSFRGEGELTKTKYWAVSKDRARAPTVNLFNGSTKEEPKSSGLPRAFCVSTR